MDDEDLLRGLARAAREEDEGDAAWQKLARSELPPEERAALEAQARTDPEAARALAAYQPFDAAELGAIAGAITGSRTEPRAVARPRAPNRGRVIALFAVPLAAAAAVALWSRRPGEALPSYELAFASTVQTMRAADDTAPITVAMVKGTTTFEMIVRPAEPVKAGVVARAALVRDGHAHEWSPPIEISPEGALRVAGPAAALFPEARGAYEIVVAVARPDDLPSAGVLQAIAERRGPATRAQVLRGRVVFIE